METPGRKALSIYSAPHGRMYAAHIQPGHHPRHVVGGVGMAADIVGNITKDIVAGNTEFASDEYNDATRGKVAKGKIPSIRALLEYCRKKDKLSPCSASFTSVQPI